MTSIRLRLPLVVGLLVALSGCGASAAFGEEQPAAGSSAAARTPDAGTSSAVAAPARLVADGVEAATVTVTVLDDVEVPVAGATVVVSGPPSVTVSPPTTASDDGGVAVFHVSSRTAQVAELTVTVRGADGDVVLPDRPSVVFSSPVDTPASLALSATSVSVAQGGNATVSATAVAPGGRAASVGAVAADASVVSVAVSNADGSAAITLTGRMAGHTTVTVTNEADPDATTGTRTLAVTVEPSDPPDGDGYGSLAARAYPAPGASAAYVDGELSLTFDAPPALAAAGAVEIRALADGALVDRIAFAGEAQSVGGTAISVGTQLARVSGSTVYLTPHFGKLAHGTSYYVAVADGAIAGTLDGRRFAGLSSQRTVATWRFSTRPAPVLGTTIHVDGSPQATTADFRTLGGALMALSATPVPGATAVRIQLAAGTYVELPHYRPARADPRLTITISGPAGNRRGGDTVVQYTNGATLNASTRTRPLLYFTGANLVLENLTLRNSGVRADVGQAEALHFASGAGYTLAAHNCSFVSRQDTLLTSGRAWFLDCDVEGNTDFVWGTADVTLLERCSLRVVNDRAGQTYAIFVARTGAAGAATVGKGYVLLRSTVSVDAGISAAYARVAGAGSWYDQVAVVGSTFSGGGTLASGLWVTTTPPASLGDSTHVGWKAAGNGGLGADTMAAAAGAASSVAGLASEYDTRDHVLNRVVQVTGGTPTGYAPAAVEWDTSALAAAWGAP